MEKIKRRRRRTLFIGTIKVGKYKGLEFSFLGLESVAPFFNPSCISLSVHKKLSTHKGCMFRRATLNDLQRTFPPLTEEIKQYLSCYLKKPPQPKPKKSHDEYSSIYIVGTVCKGEYIGTQFSFLGLENAPPFFCQYSISRVLNGSITQHRGCTFRLTEETAAAEFCSGFTTSLANDLKMMYQPKVKIWAIPVKGKYQGARFLLGDKEVLRRFFSSEAIYKILAGKNKQHFGFSFSLAKTSEIESYPKRELTQQIFNEVQDELAAFFICTILKGPLAGEQIGFTSRKLASKFFNLNLVQKALNGNVRSHNRCAFQLASYKQAAKLTKKLTPEVISFLGD